MKPIVGVVPTAHLFETDDFYKDNYIFVNNYGKRIAENGGVAVTDSNCPTQDCVHTGCITRTGQSIVCLPAQVVVHLEGASSPDAPDVIVG